MQKATFAVAIPRFFSSNFAFYDEGKLHINNITCITFECSQNSSNIIIKFPDFLFYILSRNEDAYLLKGIIMLLIFHNSHHETIMNNTLSA